jgi:hypothetical protein
LLVAGPRILHRVGAVRYFVGEAGLGECLRHTDRVKVYAVPMEGQYQQRHEDPESDYCGRDAGEYCSDCDRDLSPRLDAIPKPGGACFGFFVSGGGTAGGGMTTSDNG